MILFLLILVEEDIFKPELPTLMIKPEESWVYSMEEDWINLALSPEYYHLLNVSIGNLRIQSVGDRDFAEHYSLLSSINSISYGLQVEHTIWDEKKVIQAEGFKWIYYRSNLILGWLEGANIEDSLIYSGGIRYYHSFPSLSLGGWVNYLDTPDYGIILTFKDYRIEVGLVRRCAGYIGNWGDIKVGRFRDRFPTVFFPIENACPKTIEYYGVSIHCFNLEISAGRRNYYTYGEDTLRWGEGECYFANLGMEWERFGLDLAYQDKGMVEKYGRAFLKGKLGFLGYKFSATGFSDPIRYLSGGIELWLDNKFSPFITARNISYNPSGELLNPSYYIGIRYVH
ncbi:hypothetical protein KAX29_06975 [candidate division WOR-3 bacterium]|nr:hypothetical protein [candidate division WOR-3 bacterium]